MFIANIMASFVERVSCGVLREESEKWTVQKKSLSFLLNGQYEHKSVYLSQYAFDDAQRILGKRS